MHYWVSMTDRFMSNWGRSEGKTNKLVFECETYEQAKTVEENADKRNEMLHVKIHNTKPEFDETEYLVSWKDEESAAYWYSHHQN